MSTIQTETQVVNGTWNLDPVHSAIGFEIAYLAGTFKGQFRETSGQLTVEDGRGSLEGTAQVASVDVKDENLAQHLQSPDFFDAQQFPELRFGADDIALDGERVSGRGEITIKGVTKPVEVEGALSGPMTDGFGNERLGLQLTATVDRTEFGVDWNMELPNGQPSLPSDVRIVTDLQFVKAA
jgi:polyisoprenoid-binding protein YceI